MFSNLPHAFRTTGNCVHFHTSPAIKSNVQHCGLDDHTVTSVYIYIYIGYYVENSVTEDLLNQEDHQARK